MMHRRVLGVAGSIVGMSIGLVGVFPAGAVAAATSKAASKGITITWKTAQGRTIARTINFGQSLHFGALGNLETSPRSSVRATVADACDPSTTPDCTVATVDMTVKSIKHTGPGLQPNESSQANISGCGSLSIAVAHGQGYFNYQLRAQSNLGSWLTASYSGQWSGGIGGGSVGGAGIPAFIGSLYTDNKFYSTGGTGNTRTTLTVNFSGSVGNIFNSTNCIGSLSTAFLT